MQTRVIEARFQRTDFGSFGWINKATGDLWEVPFYAGIASLARSFRSKKPPVPFFQFYATQPIAPALVAAKTWLKRHLNALWIIFKEEECL